MIGINAADLKTNAERTMVAHFETVYDCGFRHGMAHSDEDRIAIRENVKRYVLEYIEYLRDCERIDADLAR